MAQGDPWIGIVNRSIVNTERTLLDLTKVKHLPLRFMEARGLVKTKVDWSYQKQYPIRWREPEPDGLSYGSDAHYEPFDPFRKATFKPRGRKITDAMHLVEEEQMRGSTGELVDRYAGIIPSGIKALRDDIAKSFWVDGDAAGNTEKLHGIETVTSTVKNAAAGNIIALPDSTYHGIDTDLAQAGTWSAVLSTKPNSTLATDYPEGEGTRDYHFWSPLHPNWSSSGWGTDQTGWQDNCLTCLSRTGMWMRTTHGVEGQLIGMVAPNLMSGLNDVMRATVRTSPPHAEAVRYGFHDTMNFEGMLLQAGYGIPPDTVYLFDIETVKLLIITDKLVKNKPVVFDEDKLTYKWLAYTLGNYRFVPKAIAKIKNYA